MMTLKIGDKEYIFEFTFEASEKTELVQKMFNIMSGSYIIRNVKEDEEGDVLSVKDAMISGVSEMVADIPTICKIAFHAGLLENNPVSEEEAKRLMKQYMKENKVSFKKLYEDFKKCMEDDGFFDLSGITEMIQEMEVEEKKEEETEKKVPQDHKKKQTSTK